MQTVIKSIATSNPPLRRSQEYASSFMQRITSIPPPIRSRIPQIYERSGIDFRFSCLEDYGREAEDFEFYPANWELSPQPSTSERNVLYREAVIPLTERAASEALENSGVDRSEITHLIAVSCTGFFAPGLDIELVRRLGLPADTRRTFIGFMGCYAAFNAMRVAHGFCQSHPDARVLLVCAELCTLHFQVNGSFESAIVNAIFSDGAAAAVLAGVPDEEAAGELMYIEGQTALDADSMEDMTWDIGDTGFVMGLSSRVPTVIADRLPSYLDGLLSPYELAVRDIDFWAIHPGGRAIIDKAQEVLDLTDDAVHDSLEVLRLHGNMSSPTILFVLKRILDRKETVGTGVALAFGPGLTIEGALLGRV
jgi:predicted naringenin-chalcone synthase